MAIVFLSTGSVVFSLLLLPYFSVSFSRDVVIRGVRIKRVTVTVDHGYNGGQHYYFPSVCSSQGFLLPSNTSTSLSMVGWMGNPPTANDDIAVRIERPSPNSRRILSEIQVKAPLEDIWAIITDYDNLATHVPNLVESRRISTNRGRSGVNNNNNNDYGDNGVQGDGHYRCRLYQKGAKNIIGFDFSASVTMDMQEKIFVERDERRIGFKIAESQFFSMYDGEWIVARVNDSSSPSSSDWSTLKYVVEVRPNGPVPVAALEWQIKEEVPNNLNAVKKAALALGLATRNQKKKEGEESSVSIDNSSDSGSANVSSSLSLNALVNSKMTLRRLKMQQEQQKQQKAAAETVEETTNRGFSTNNSRSKRTSEFVNNIRRDLLWEDDETMAAYLKNPKKM